MTGSSMKRWVAVLLCIGLSSLWAAFLRDGVYGAFKSTDLAEVYLATRCAIEHKDPYDGRALLAEYQAGGGKISGSAGQEAEQVRTVVAVERNLPTSMFVILPIAMLPWGVAATVTPALMSALFALAGYLMWELGADAAPWLSGWMACFILANCELLLVIGNLAGICVPLCVIAAWCLVKKRYEAAGVIALALSLVIKPHDAGFVWLYFLLAGGAGRKRALQTLALTAALGIGAAAWIAPVSPHWMQELHANLAADATHGGLNDPSPAGGNHSAFDPIISLQVAGSVLKNDVHFYNPFSDAIGGVLLLAWAIAVWRKRGRGAREEALLGLAVASILTLLPVYHRNHDAKLLLLAIPACALLWVRGGARRWAALGMTAVAVAATSDVPVSIWVNAMSGLAAYAHGAASKLALLLLEPAPLVLLAAGCFYLWVYIRYEPAAAGAGERERPLTPIAEAAAN